jgi:type I site-specific restriction endonuclease
MTRRKPKRKAATAGKKRGKKIIRKNNSRKIISSLNPKQSEIAREVEEAVRDIARKISLFDDVLSPALRDIEKRHKEIHALFNERIDEVNESGHAVIELHDLICAVVKADRTAEKGIKLLRSLFSTYNDAVEEYAKIISLGPL